MKMFIFLIALCLSLATSAQDKAKGSFDAPYQQEDSTAFKMDMPYYPQADFSPFSIFSCRNLYGWQLHEGLNASLSLSATFGLGSGSPSGVGFGKDIDLMYAFPISKRWSAAAGLYVSDFSWGWMNNREIGFSGIASYRISDNVTLSAYANKSIAHNRRNFPLYPAQGGDVYGGRIDVKISEKVAVGLSVEHREEPDYRLPVWQKPRITP